MKNPTCKITAQMNCVSLNRTFNTDKGRERPKTRMNSRNKTNGNKMMVDGGTN